MDVSRFIFNGDKFTFAICGLDIRRNILQAPPCPDGCGETCNILIESGQELGDFCSDILMEVEGDECGIFCILNNGNIMTFVKGYDEEEEYGIFGYETRFPIGMCDYSMIGDIAIDRRLHLYGLMVEEADHEFTVIEK